MTTDNVVPFPEPPKPDISKLTIDLPLGAFVLIGAPNADYEGFTIRLMQYRGVTEITDPDMIENIEAMQLLARGLCNLCVEETAQVAEIGRLTMEDSRYDNQHPDAQEAAKPTALKDMEPVGSA